MIIAIDGPAGTGKSTVAERISKALNLTYLNSGSFYRALTLALISINYTEDNKVILEVRDKIEKLHTAKSLQEGGPSWETLKEKVQSVIAIIKTKEGRKQEEVKEAESFIAAFSGKQDLDYKDSHLILNKIDVEEVLHSDVVSAFVSPISAIVSVRHLVNERMKSITRHLDIVCEGRDMTTVVFPEAKYKFYLDASIEVQAERRYRQGVSKLSLEEIKEAIKVRDLQDKNKQEGALKIAPDAHYIDTTHLTINEVCAMITSIVKG